MVPRQRQSGHRAAGARLTNGRSQGTSASASLSAISRSCWTRSAENLPLPSQYRPRKPDRLNRRRTMWRNRRAITGDVSDLGRFDRTFWLEWNGGMRESFRLSDHALSRDGLHILAGSWTSTMGERAVLCLFRLSQAHGGPTPEARGRAGAGTDRVRVAGSGQYVSLQTSCRNCNGLGFRGTCSGRVSEFSRKAGDRPAKTPKPRRRVWPWESPHRNGRPRRRHAKLLGSVTRRSCRNLFGAQGH